MRGYSSMSARTIAGTVCSLCPKAQRISSSHRCRGEPVQIQNNSGVRVLQMGKTHTPTTQTVSSGAMSQLHQLSERGLVGIAQYSRPPASMKYVWVWVVRVRAGREHEQKPPQRVSHMSNASISSGRSRTQAAQPKEGPVSKLAARCTALSIAGSIRLLKRGRAVRDDKTNTVTVDHDLINGRITPSTPRATSAAAAATVQSRVDAALRGREVGTVALPTGSATCASRVRHTQQVG
jgi:hypothetical protein